MILVFLERLIKQMSYVRWKLAGFTNGKCAAPPIAPRRLGLEKCEFGLSALIDTLAAPLFIGVAVDVVTALVIAVVGGPNRAGKWRWRFPLMSSS